MESMFNKCLLADSGMMIPMFKGDSADSDSGCISFSISRKLCQKNKNVTMFCRCMLDMLSSSRGLGAGPKIGPGRAFAWPERKLLGPCWDQNKQPNSKRIYRRSGSNINAGFDAGPVQLDAVPVRCWAWISGKFLQL